MNQKTIDELAVEERKAYFKAWRAANPDKAKRHRENYWRRKAEQRLAKEVTNNE